MMSSELGAIIRGITPVLKEHLASTVGGLTTRLIALEAREPIVGPRGDTGEKGTDGANGKDGADGKDGGDGANGANGQDGRDIDEAVLIELRARLTSIEAIVTAPKSDLALDQVAMNFTALLRKEIGAFDVAPVRMQRHVLRDRSGRIDRIVEEPVT